ncbi:MAG: mechanosensitive ion channel family protein [Moorea sp. SIO2B7]|nr:mechanosensitive ion channel family protein [Moorena sp. SIO2B7]
MTEIWTQIQPILFNTELTFINIPVGKIILVIIILLLIFALKKFFVKRITNTIEVLTSQTETDLDDQLIVAIKKPLGWLVLLVGVWIAHLILGVHLSSQLNGLIDKFTSVFLILILGLTLYRLAPLLGQMVGLLAAKTETELDDLIVPYIPKLFQTAAIVMIVIKCSELLLGASAGALIGLLGGAGVALGLLLKDIIYDWFCTVVVYVDNLYRPGDWGIVSGVAGGGFVKVVSIGLRSTKLWVYEWGSIQKVPNSRMINGGFENWSQDQGEEKEWGIVVTLKIDSILAKQTARIIDKLEKIVESVEELTNKYSVFLDKLEGNARVIKIKTYAYPNLYASAKTKLNLAILSVLEEEGVDTPQSHVVTDPKTNQQMMQELNNVDLN